MAFEESSSEGNENSSSLGEDMALFFKSFNEMMKSHKFKSRKKHNKSRSRKICYNYGKNGHFIDNCPYDNKDDMEEKEEKKVYAKNKKFFKKRHSREAHMGKE